MHRLFPAPPTLRVPRHSPEFVRQQQQAGDRSPRRSQTVHPLGCDLGACFLCVRCVCLPLCLKAGVQSSPQSPSNMPLRREPRCKAVRPRTGATPLLFFVFFCCCFPPKTPHRTPPSASSKTLGQSEAAAIAPNWFEIIACVWLFVRGARSCTAGNRWAQRASRG